ncbi:iron-containing alcohol dehydrogenase [Clostridium cadaveris]|uniref:iron-containing alcohol dehydrogenase n=1 Tax=Clostridium cadaveris TaxID=1529 RepID=UPI0004108DE6|nr:iron-containing alcohol dehydrogenase [Clostridium cadaveris]
MINFQYNNPARVIFGDGAEKSIEALFVEYNVKSLLLVYSGSFIKDLGIWDTVHSTCKKLNIAFYEEGNVVPNPKIELVRNLVSLGKSKSVDFVLAVGGGSSIDTAKAVSIGVPYDGDVWDFFEGKSDIKEALPIGVITTLPSSGSETSNCSIISNGILKVGVESDLIIPKFAVMNPRFTMGLPPYQTSCGLADILSHLLERYFTDVENVDTTDYLIEGAVKALMLNAERLMMNPKDYNARAEVQWLASIAHNNLLDTGRISDWGSHRIEHELSAQYGITHGEGMSVVLIAWTHYMALNKPKKLAQLANRLYGIDYHNYTEKEMALILSKKLKEFFSSLNLKTTLSELNIGDEHFEEMALRATNNNTSTVGHYIPLDKNKFIDILHLAK